jgi:hypothetical protein
MIDKIIDFAHAEKKTPKNNGEILNNQLFEVFFNAKL